MKMSMRARALLSLEFIRDALHDLVPFLQFKTTTTAVDPRHLKVEEDIKLTKNYCIIINIQKISSIHKFILKIKQILGSHEIKGNGHF